MVLSIGGEAVDGRPAGGPDEEAHGVDGVRLVAREPVVDPLRQRHEVPLLDVHAHPVILGIAHVEEAAPPQDVADLLAVVDVFREEVLHVRVEVGEKVGMDGEHVGVGVPAVVTFDAGKYDGNRNGSCKDQPVPGRLSVSFLILS